MIRGDLYRGKIVEVHRYFSIAEMSQTDPQVKDWLGQSYRAVGPYFKEKATGTGLSFDEQKLLLPGILGIEHIDRDFRKAVNNHYDNLVIAIPHNGLKLQISLINDNEVLSETNKPLNIQDYIKWRFIEGHPEVAGDLNEAARLSVIKKFYIHDPDKVSKEAVDINTLEDKATNVYMKYKDDKIKLDQLLTMLGINIKGMKHEDKVLKLKQFSKKDVKYVNELDQKAAFDNFIKVAEDRDMEYKYLIQELIGAQHLQRVGSNIVYKETGDKLGDSMEDAVLHLKNAKNSRELNLLKAQYLQKIKHGSEAYLPKEAEEVKAPKQKAE
jgi:hypothetical protein